MSLRNLSMLVLIVALLAATWLLVRGIIREYRDTGHVAWWWLPPIQMHLLTRWLVEAYPEMQWSRKEKRLMKLIGLFGLMLVTFAITYFVAGLVVAASIDLDANRGAALVMV